MKILLTGSKGMLGSDLQAVLTPAHEILGIDLPEHDITDYDHMRRIGEEFQPEIILHCAANTDVDGCELNPEQAFRVNTLGTQNMVYTAMHTGASMLYISTDYVFDGLKSTPYQEFDLPNPGSIYGKSKYGGELAVLRHLSKFFIVRTSWLFGRQGKNFVSTILRLAQNHDELKIINDQHGCPTYSRDLALALSRLIVTPYYGIYHITNTGSCTWFQFAQKILNSAGINKTVIPITTRDLNRPAPRPEYSVLDNGNYLQRGFPALSPYAEALGAYLETKA